MKFRSDYVTNSSSSSFIFKDFDKQELDIFLEEKGWKGKDDFILMEFTAYNMDALLDVFLYYEDYLLSRITGENCSGFYNSEMVKTFLKEYFSKNHSREIMQKLAIFYVLKVIEEYDYVNLGKEKIKQKCVLTREYIDELFQWYRVKDASPYDSFHDFFCDNYDEIYTLSQGFIGSHCGELLASLFEAKYLCYKRPMDNLDLELEMFLDDYPYCITCSGLME